MTTTTSNIDAGMNSGFLPPSPANQTSDFQKNFKKAAFLYQNIEGKYTDEGRLFFTEQAEIIKKTSLLSKIYINFFGLFGEHAKISALISCMPEKSKEIIENAQKSLTVLNKQIQEHAPNPTLKSDRTLNEVIDSTRILLQTHVATSYIAQNDLREAGVSKEITATFELDDKVIDEVTILESDLKFVKSQGKLVEFVKNYKFSGN